MGSKTKIAPNILAQLPSGRRFVDLFGGGFSMSHAAILSRRWGGIYYNELNPQLPPLIRDALAGKYNYNVFKPEFITREMFKERMNADGYVNYIWSFGSRGYHYLFAEEIEPLKHEAHDFVVFGKPTTHFKRIESKVTSKDIHTRRLQFNAHCKTMRKWGGLEQLERLERLQQLERLERYEIHCGSYEDYEYRDGDVVYCDPPYENTQQYEKGGFNHEKFYDWVATRPYPVWFSSYAGLANDFKLVWAKRVKSTLSATNNNCVKYECLYTNGQAGMEKENN